MRNRVILISIVVISFCGIVLVQKNLSGLKGPSWTQESMTYLPGQDRIKGALLGFESTLSHYLWIRTILYFGSHYLSDNSYPWLIKMVDMITRLNPWFYPAYEFAGLMIPDLCKSPDAARVILERGIFYMGDKKWNMAFYMGMIYHKYYNDNQTAAQYFSIAAQVPSEHSHKLAGLAAAFYEKAGSQQDGINFLLFMFQTSENPEVRRHLSQKIREYGSSH